MVTPAVAVEAILDVAGEAGEIKAVVVEVEVGRDMVVRDMVAQAMAAQVKAIPLAGVGGDAVVVVGVEAAAGRKWI